MRGAETHYEEIPMRSRIVSLVLVSAALMGATASASAQSPYSYPWCSRQLVRDGFTTSCYFTSYQQCMTTISGIGGYCYQSPYYHGPATALGQAAVKRHRRIRN
jgi:hypothetical protein